MYKAQAVYVVVSNRRSRYPLLLVEKYSKLKIGSMIAFRSEVHSKTLRRVSTETDQISR